MNSANVNRSVIIVIVGIVLALGALALLNGLHTPPSALAGPCAGKPKLYRADDNPGEVDPIDSAELFLLSGTSESVRHYRVIADPFAPPSGKPSPYLKIEIKALTGTNDPNITISWDPATAELSFYTDLHITVGKNAYKGKHPYDVTITCHPTDPVTTTIPFDLWVDQCPAPPPTDSPTPTKTAKPNAADIQDVRTQDDQCTIPTDTPAPTPVVTPSPTPLPGNVTWGDVECSAMSSLTTEETLALLKHALQDALASATPTPTATPAPGSCPIWKAIVKISQIFGFHAEANTGLQVAWGDFNCSGSADVGDALSVLRYLAGFTDQFPSGCPAIGDRVQVDPA